MAQPAGVEAEVRHRVVERQRIPEAPLVLVARRREEGRDAVREPARRRLGVREHVEEVGERKCAGRCGVPVDDGEPAVLRHEHVRARQVVVRRDEPHGLPFGGTPHALELGDVRVRQPDGPGRSEQLALEELAGEGRLRRGRDVPAHEPARHPLDERVPVAGSLGEEDGCRPPLDAGRDEERPTAELALLDHLRHVRARGPRRRAELGERPALGELAPSGQPRADLCGELEALPVEEECRAGRSHHGRSRATRPQPRAERPRSGRPRDRRRRGELERAPGRDPREPSARRGRDGAEGPAHGGTFRRHEAAADLEHARPELEPRLARDRRSRSRRKPQEREAVGREPPAQRLVRAVDDDHVLRSVRDAVRVEKLESPSVHRW